MRRRAWLHPPVEVPQDAGAVLADADEDAVGLAHKQAGDFPRVAVQVDLSFHLHLGGLLFTQTQRGHSAKRPKTENLHASQIQIQLKIINSATGEREGGWWGEWR